ncbi:hypothetical protein [Flexivirga oryzae]|uniref:Uncharacterized protein n=1 Tax=Flexivirga oryzae TaxID=1794944 RepID=A0A839N038_9MICO|nr:hypothetical protein [Flexivirga oryzae]MBB2891080.1 hypothetical protein [Flexivirga oryzae]
MTTTRVAGVVPVGALVPVVVPGALVEDAAVEDAAVEDVVGGAVVEPVEGVVDFVGADVPDVAGGVGLLETGDPVVVLVIPVPVPGSVAVSPLDWQAVRVVAARAAASRPIGAR